MLTRYHRALYSCHHGLVSKHFNFGRILPDEGLADLTMSCESWDTNAPYDVVPTPGENHMNPIALYLGEKAEEYLTHPYASPLFGDLKGLPPLLIQAGDAEVLRDEVRLLAHKASSAGVQVMHELYDDAVRIVCWTIELSFWTDIFFWFQIHVFQAYPFLEASRRSFESMHTFVRNVLPRHRTRSPQLLASTTERGLEQEMENDRTVVVGGDGAEESSSGSKQFQMAEFAESEQENEQRNSTDDASWVLPPVWRKNSNPMKLGQSEYSSDLDMEDIPELQLSSPPSPFNQSRSASFSSLNSNMTFISNTPLPSRSSHPTLSFRDPRRIQSTSSLAAKVTFRFHNVEEPIACPTPPPTTFPPSSPIQPLRFDMFSPSSTLQREYHHHQSYRRSKSGAQVPHLMSCQQQCIYPLYSPSPPWTMPKGRLMMASRKKPFYLTGSDVVSLQV